MSPQTVKLTSCDKEPIHIPGSIQPHGFLFAADLETLIIEFASENVKHFLGTKKTYIGKNLGKEIGDIRTMHDHYSVNDLLEKAISEGPETESSGQLVWIGKKIYYIIFSFTESQIIVEFEPVIFFENITQTILKNSNAILHANTLDEIVQATAREVKSLLNYDRVMVYYFRKIGTGEVVAECKEENLDTWYGLRYPESDIPKQARELYLKNKVRLIGDVHAETIKLEGPKGKKLDLTHASLRAVSPIHIQYLKNMGVSSSYSVSIVVNDKLWGLIVCLNYSVKPIDYKLRQATKLLGEMAASCIRMKEGEEEKLIENSFNNVAFQLYNQLTDHISIEDAIINQSTNLLQLTHASGAALSYDDRIILLGKTPSLDQVKKIISWAADETPEQIFHSQDFSKEYPPAKKFLDSSAGILISILRRDIKEMILWFKPEKIETVKWAGKPEKIITTTKKGEVNFEEMSPRTSFDIWKEQVKNTSEEWQEAEINSAKKITKLLEDTRLKKNKDLVVLDNRLKKAYEELDSFTYTVSHDLKTPLTVMRTYAQYLIHSKALKEDRSQAMAEKIVSNVDKMSEMMEELLALSRVKRHQINHETINVKSIIDNILKESMVAHNYSNTSIKVKKTPEVSGDPVLVHQVFSNVLENALKYSSKATGPKVLIDATTDKGVVTYSITDNGIGIPEEQKHLVFEIFKRLDNTDDFEGTGVGLAIVKGIMEKLNGNITFDSQPGKGTTFYLQFNSHMN